MALSVPGAHAPCLRAQNPMANMDMAAFPGRTYRYLQVRPPATATALRHSALLPRSGMQPAARTPRRSPTAAAALPGEAWTARAL
jgi:hypothetical protein